MTAQCPVSRRPPYTKAATIQTFSLLYRSGAHSRSDMVLHCGMYSRHAILPEQKTAQSAILLQMILHKLLRRHISSAYSVPAKEHLHCTKNCAKKMLMTFASRRCTPQRFLSSVCHQQVPQTEADGQKKN